MDCEVEMQRGSVLGLSPSFNRYDSGRLAEIAARILGELGESEFQAEIETRESVSSFEIKAGINGDEVKGGNDDEEVKEDEIDSDGEYDDDSEFTFAWREPETSPISADEIFFNGQIRPIFSIFNRDLLMSEEQNREVSVTAPTPASIRLPLRKLLIEERGTASCSSSEADELEGVLPGTYCVWTPKAAAAESPPGRCRKSNSTGSSKRWKFRDFLHRSNSDGKDTFVFLTPNSSLKKKTEKESTSSAGKPKPKSGTGENVTSANRKNNTAAAKKEVERRRSFLPYRQDLVGFFANVNGLSRNLHPF